MKFLWRAIFSVTWNWVLIRSGNVHPSGKLYINKSNVAGYILIFKICRANFLNPNWGLINDGIKSDFLRLSWKSFWLLLFYDHFWLFFCQPHWYFSQNWDPDCHSEVFYMFEPQICERHQTRNGRKITIVSTPLA